MINKTTKLLITSAFALSAFTANADINDIMMKARAGFLHTSEKIKTGSGATAAAQDFKNGYVGELAFTHFFDSTFGMELSGGFGRTKLKNNAGNSKEISYIPVTATAQVRYNTGSVTPYLGVGYSYHVMSKGADSTKVKNGGGIVAQAGLDLMTGDTFGWNLDVKHTFKANHKITETGGETFANKMSTTTAMAGIVFKY